MISLYISLISMKRPSDVGSAWQRHYFMSTIVSQLRMLDGWRDELYPIYNKHRDQQISGWSAWVLQAACRLWVAIFVSGTQD